MRGIRQWLASAAVVAGASVVAAQAPAPLPTPLSEAPQSTGLPGGAVVGSSVPQAKPAIVPAAPSLKVAAPAPPSVKLELPPAPSVKVATPPVASVTIMRPTTTPVAEPAPPAVLAPVAPVDPTLPPAKPAVIPGVTPTPVQTPEPPIVGIMPAPVADCCGPVGAHGPVGQEIFLRVGPSFPIADGVLSKNLNRGFTIQFGGRSQLFDSDGAAAWAIEPHIIFSNNKGKEKDIITLGGEAVRISGLYRWAVGVGLGRDYFLARPGFVLDTWDMNFRLGWDVGGRWGTGHVDFSPAFEFDGYRRNHDVFAQTFAGITGTMEMPMGAYTALFGGRVEWDYTFSDFVPRGSGFHEINAMLMLGVRY